MNTEVTSRIIPVVCAPKKAPCPFCGTFGKRKRIHSRTVRSIAYKQIVTLEITYGEYASRCQCCKFFRTHPEDVLPKAKYDNKVRQAVLDSILEDGLNVEAVQRRMQRDFLLNLSSGFLYDSLRDAVRQLDMAEHRQEILQRFSGVLCVDEVHLGRFTLLMATDPISDIPVAFALVSANDQDHMRRFLQNLQRSGFEPRVVVTDGSSLYPAVLAELWPEAEHQLCVFHVMQDLNKLILKALRRMRQKMSRQGNKGRRRKRGRQTKAQKRQRAKQRKTLRQKSKFVFKHRYLIVKRWENFSEQDKQNLQTLFEYLPELQSLRKFTDRLHKLFDSEQSEHQAQCRWSALQRTPEFPAIPELAHALESLCKEKFSKMIAFLRGPAGQHRQVRTNNHVERCNRKLRFLEKVRYKWRRRRTLVRYLVLTLDRWWKKACSPSQVSSDRTPPSPVNGKRNPATISKAKTA